MTWTYTGDPTDSDLDAVRFELGDTDIDDQLLNDEEVLYLLVQFNNNRFRAAAAGAEALALFFAREVDIKNSRLSASASQRSKQFKTCARRLWSRGGITVGENGRTAIAANMFVGGLSLNDKRNFENETDLVQNAFFKGQDDHPEAPNDSGFIDLTGSND